VAPPPFGGTSPATPGQSKSTLVIGTLAVQGKHFMIAAWVGIGLMFVSSFLPWVEVFGISVSGTHGDGKITAFMAVVSAILFGISMTRRDVAGRNLMIGSLASTMVCFGVFAYDFVNISTSSSSSEGFQVAVSPGIGVILGPIAGVAALLGLVMQLRGRAGELSAPRF
jgi:hypothetical protein